MAQSRHQAADLAAFAETGETRLIYARYRQDLTAPLYFLRDGEASTVREMVKADLECPMSDCNDRRLMAVSRYPRKRDGFSHYPGAGGHAPEGVNHLQAKELVARWVARTTTDLRVDVEHWTPLHDRKADVMLTWADGHQIAIEIQYSGLTPEAWMRRHESYRRQGVVDVWLLGHTPPNLRPVIAPADKEAHEVQLTPLHSTMLAHGVPLLWINPILEQIGTVSALDSADSWSDLFRREIVWRDGYDGVELVSAVRAEMKIGLLRCSPLESCRLSSDGIWLPGQRREVDNRERLDMVNEDRHRRDKDRAQTVQESYRRAAARQAVVNESRYQRRRQRAARAASEADRIELARSQRRDQWEATPLHGWLQEHFGRVPAAFTVTLPNQAAIRDDPAAWRALLYSKLMHNRRDQRFTVATCVSVLVWARVTISGRAERRDRAVAEWLEHMRQRRYLASPAPGEYEVGAYPLEYKPGRPRVARSARTAAAGAPATATSPARILCRACGGPVAADFEHLRLHPVRCCGNWDLYA